jgi:putative membrane protein
MTIDARAMFPEAEREAIRAAVAAAEARSGGEVVSWITGSCDDYPESSWMAATGGALLGLGLGWLGHALSGAWGGILLWAVVPALAGATAGFLLGRLPAVKRLLVPDETMERRVEIAAEAAFLRAEVFATRDRTGILIFVALLEHRVEVLADSGIHARVPAERWAAIAEEIAAGIRSGAAPAAVIAGVERCGSILAEHCVPRREDDRDELPDRPRFGEDR